MNIYVLTRKGPTDWDQYDSFCVAARNSREARQITMTDAGNWDNCDWTSPRDADILKVGTAGPRVKAGVLVSSFNAS